MPSSPAERDEFCEYFCGSGAITCRVLYRTEQLAFVQLRTVDWPGYKDFSNYARVALFHEHLRPANLQSPGVRNFVQALVRELAAQQSANAKNQRAKEGVTHDVSHLEKPTITEKLRATQGNGVKPPPKSAPARGRKARANAAEVHSLKPVRSISGLTLAEFLYDR
jgi:hypothetical protein